MLSRSSIENEWFLWRTAKPMLEDPEAEVSCNGCSTMDFDNRTIFFGENKSKKQQIAFCTECLLESGFTITELRKLPDRCPIEDII